MNVETLDPVRLHRVERSPICNFALALGILCLVILYPVTESLAGLRKTFLP